MNAADRIMLYMYASTILGASLGESVGWTYVGGILGAAAGFFLATWVNVNRRYFV